MSLTLRKKNYQILKSEAWLKKKKLVKPMGVVGKSPLRKSNDDPSILVIMCLDRCAMVKFEKPCTDRMSSPFFFSRYKKIHDLCLVRVGP